MAIIYADNNNFDESVKDGVVLVDFYAEWCGPCQALCPILDVISNEIESVKIVKVDVDNSPEIAQKFGIMSMPTMLIFKDGQKVDQKIGLLQKEDLVTWIKQF